MSFELSFLCWFGDYYRGLMGCSCSWFVAHINNLYNTAFWALVQQGGMSTKEAHATLSVRLSPPTISFPLLSLMPFVF